MLERITVPIALTIGPANNSWTTKLHLRFDVGKRAPLRERERESERERETGFNLLVKQSRA